MGSRPHRSSDHIALGRAVRELREHRGLSQTLVGYDAYLHYHYIGTLENGRMNPSFGILLAIVRTLGSSLAELVEVYERRLAEIDPTAGHGVALCPTPEALAYLQRLQASERVKVAAVRRRGRMRTWT